MITKEIDINGEKFLLIKLII